MQTIVTDGMREAFRWAYPASTVSIEPAEREVEEVLHGDILHLDCSQWDRRAQPYRVMEVADSEIDLKARERRRARDSERHAAWVLERERDRAREEREFLARVVERKRRERAEWEAQRADHLERPRSDMAAADAEREARSLARWIAKLMAEEDS